MLYWRAVYKNGDSLSQFDKEGRENKYTKIDRAHLERFELVKENKEVSFSLILEEGQRLIHRRIRFKTMNFKTGKIIDTVAYMVGWQQTIEEKNVQAISYLLPNGSIIMAGKWKKGDALRNEPECFLECEK